MTTSEVAQQLKFSIKQIQDLEVDDYSKLPGNTLVRGMIRSYAKLLQIDPAPLLEAHTRRDIPAAVRIDVRSKRIPFPDGVKRSTRTYGLLTAVLFLLVVGVAYEWQMTAGESTPLVFLVPPKPVADSMRSRQPDLVAPSALPPVTNPPPVEEKKMATQALMEVQPVAAVPPVKFSNAPKSGDLRRIELEFSKDSWVEIKQGDGRTLLSQFNAGGTRQMLEGKPPFTLVIGNAPTVRLTYNNKPVDLRPHFKVDVARLTLE